MIDAPNLSPAGMRKNKNKKHQKTLAIHGDILSHNTAAEISYKAMVALILEEVFEFGMTTWTLENYGFV